LQNKPAPLYSGDRKSPSSQPENLPSQTNSNPVGDYQPSPQSPNLKFGFLPANRQQNQSDTNAIGTIENNFSQTRVNGEGFSGEQMPKAPEYWSSEKTKENLSGQKGQNFKISPFQNEIDINRSGVDYRPWPELPEETPVENEATNWQLVRRKLEHLRRLDEEQRGSYGAGSLFN
jgi:hypothetical protein